MCNILFAENMKTTYLYSLRESRRICTKLLTVVIVVIVWIVSAENKREFFIFLFDIRWFIFSIKACIIFSNFLKQGFTMYPRMTLNSHSSCLSLLSTRITDLCHYAHPYFYNFLFVILGLELRAFAMSHSTSSTVCVCVCVCVCV
jgi:hypothetical protein